MFLVDLFLFTGPDALTLRALTLRFLINFGKLTAKNTNELGNLAKKISLISILFPLNVTIFWRLARYSVTLRHQAL